MKNSIEVFEVGPRDGLQSEKTLFPTQDKIEFIKLLCQASFKNIEIGSFVKKDSIPQLSDTPEIADIVLPWKEKNFPEINFWAFAPNLIGMEKGLEKNIDGIGCIVASSDSFNKNNVNRSQKELLEEIIKMNALALSEKKLFRVYLSTLSHCPFEGDIAPHKILSLTNQLVDAGVKNIVLSDTTGRAHPEGLKKIYELLLKEHSPELFSLHFHATHALALVNAYESIQWGFYRFDSSLGGLGGCPYAPGASGNLATEDLLNLIQTLENKTMNNWSAIKTAALFIEEKFKIQNTSKIYSVLKAKNEVSQFPN